MCTPPIDFAVSGANIFVCPVNILLRCFRWLFSLKPFPCNILSYSDCILLTEWATLHISPSCFVVSFWLPYNILYIVKYSSDRLWIHFPLPCLCVRHKLFSESAILLELDCFYVVFAFCCFFRVLPLKSVKHRHTQSPLTELFSPFRFLSLSLALSNDSYRSLLASVVFRRPFGWLALTIVWHVSMYK